MKQKVLVAIPAYNEAETVGDVIRSVREALPEVAILVVDDGSRDGTTQAAKDAGARVATLPYNMGIGGALRTAFVYARDHNFDVMVQVDADGQHDPASVPDLVAALDDADIVIGSRFEEGDYHVHGPRKWAMFVLRKSLSRVTKTELTDATSGFRASSRPAIELFAEHFPSEYLGDCVDSTVIASRVGLKYKQIPANIRERQGGTPSQNTLKSTLHLGRAVLAISIALAKRPPAGFGPQATGEAP